MWNKFLILLVLLVTQKSIAFEFSIPKIPMFGDFNPNQLSQNFNQFVGIKPNYQRENRMISEIEDAVMDGEVEYLTLADEREVFSIHIEPDTDKPKGGVIILHNRGQHANWEDTIKPLRIGLAENGWHTLSVQMPVLDKTAKYYDYVPIFPYSHVRINAAIEFYKKRGINNIVLISHGCGSHMANSYIDKYTDKDIKAFVGIGMGATDYRQKIVSQFPFYKMQKPILDVYAQYDFTGVVRLAIDREELMEAGKNTKSKQIVIEQAKHYYKDSKSIKQLISKISTWIDGLNN